MERKIDFTKPVSKNINDYKEVLDCFGQSFDITKVACAKCHDNEICSIMFRDNVIENKIKEVESKVPKIMDKEDNKLKKEVNESISNVDFSTIDSVKLEKFLINEADSNKPLKVEALLQFAMKKADTDDRKAAIDWLVGFVKNSGKIKTRDGLVIRK